MAHELSDGELERIAAFARTRRYDRKPDMLRPEADEDDQADAGRDR